MQTLGILIGRFSPLHTGHRDLIRQAKSKCDCLLILVGSANSARTIKTPFTYSERRYELQQFINHENIGTLGTVLIYPLNDYKYSNSQWISDVVFIVDTTKNHDNIILFGHDKEDTNYLNWFPQYKFQNIDTVYEVCSTDIRTNWFETAPKTHFTQEVIDDYNYFKNEKKLFSDYPFKETLQFNCADVILECAGHILLIQRARAPGQGTWALPGGFKNNNETFIDCAIRELQEETNVRVPEKILRGSIVNTRLFDSPNRGMGIPRNTLCVHIGIELDADGKLPRANGADDAMDCSWEPIDKIMNEIPMFDDHGAIISSMCGTVPRPAHKNPRF